MAKHKYIETPEKMLELFEAYKEEVKDNPKLKNDFAGKDADEVVKKLERPLTMEGFENYVFKKGLNAELSHYFSNFEDRYKDYIAICSHIRREIRQDQIEGGMVGLYNPSITQRLNGLVEKVETKNEHTGDIKVTLNLT
jgi:hypothetical protein